MDKKPFILAINGSPYKDGIVCELLRAVFKGAEQAGAETKLVHLYDLIIQRAAGLYSANPEREIVAEQPQDDLTALYPEIIRADGIVFGTPVYWANMSGAMKDFFDRLTPLENEGFQLEGKIAVCIAASKENEGGVEMAALSMLAAVTQMGMLIPPNGVMWHPGRWVTAEKDAGSWAMEDAPIVGKNMVQLIQLLGENPIHWSE